MRFFLAILSVILFLGLSVYQRVGQAEENGLLLLRILSIDGDRHEMLLEMADRDKNMQEGFIYSFQSVSESFKKGDLIRIWGTIERKAGENDKHMETGENINTTEDVAKTEKYKIENISDTKIVIAGTINGFIAGISYDRNGGGVDLTGVRKRLQRRIMSPNQPSKGMGRRQR